MSEILNEKQTVYFIIYTGDEVLNFKNKDVMAWSTDKDKAKFYLDFHTSKKLKLKKITDTRGNLLDVINSNINTEIIICQLVIEVDGEEKIVKAPVTELETTDLNEFIGSMGEGFIDYRIIFSKLHYLKNKYQKALNKLFLGDIIKYVMFNERNSLVERITLNQVKLLIKFHPNLFID